MTEKCRVLFLAPPLRYLINIFSIMAASNHFKVFLVTLIVRVRLRNLPKKKAKELEVYFKHKIRTTETI
jgi:hypothetical protein